MLNLIVAACEGFGIGKDMTLPWRLREELKFFARMTKTTRDPQKQNAVIMGRRTWESIPKKNRPLQGRLNVILTRNPSFSFEDENVLIQRSLKEALATLGTMDSIENLWLIGGTSVYAEAIESGLWNKIYLTRIHKFFECDTFFPKLDWETLHKVKDENVPEGVLTEGDVSYSYEVYEKSN